MRLQNPPERVRMKARDSPEWTVRKNLIRKDGYELYFYDGGFEFAMRHPETRGDAVIVEKDDIDTCSPHYAALAEWVFDNVEKLAAESDKI